MLLATLYCAGVYLRLSLSISFSWMITKFSNMLSVEIIVEEGIQRVASQELCARDSVIRFLMKLPREVSLVYLLSTNIYWFIMSW